MQSHVSGASRDYQDPHRFPTTGTGQAATEEKLAAKLEKVAERLAADAPKMRQPGAALVAHYLDADRLPVQERWSRKHAHTQGRLCALHAAPVIAAIACQDIRAGHMQQIATMECSHYSGSSADHPLRGPGGTTE